MAVSLPVSATYDVFALREQEFPISRRTAYLNHAGISPLPSRTAKAVQDLTERMSTELGDLWPWLMKQTELLGETLKLFINAQNAHEIVGVQSTSIGVNLIAQSFPWQPGDNVVLCDIEFPSNAYPWMQLAETRGIEVRLVPAHGKGLLLDELRKHVDSRTRLVAASSVQFLTGHRTDVQAIGEFCHERGIAFAVDAIQSAGHIPIDVQASHISTLVVGGQKSLLALPGHGFMYVRDDLAAQMRPAFLSATNTVDYIHWLKYDMTPLAGASRFSSGTFNVLGAIGLLESVRLLREIGVANIDRYTTSLSGYAIDQLEALGCTILTPRNPAERGPIVTFAPRTTDDKAVSALIEGLSARHIVAVKHWDSAKNAYIRVSFHAYNTPEEVDRLIAALKELSL